MNVVGPVNSCAVVLRLYHPLLSWQVHIEMLIGGFPSSLVCFEVRPVEGTEDAARKALDLFSYGYTPPDASQLG